MVTHLENLFPGLRGSGYEVKSRQDDVYNCIAWATGATQTAMWWWPFGDPRKTNWPEGVPREETLEAFREAFQEDLELPRDPGDGLGTVPRNRAKAGFPPNPAGQ